LIWTPTGKAVDARKRIVPFEKALLIRRPHNGCMSTTTPLLTPREAARMLSISYPTIKQWILAGKLKTRQTPGGHHRISMDSLKPLLTDEKGRHVAKTRERFRRVSGRNQLIGKIVSIQVDGLMAQVVLSFGNQQVSSIITAEAVRELGLRKGDTAAALVKSTDVMIERVDYA
jgi:molybdopterin-binding protein